MRLESRTSTLQELYAEETAKIREHFEAFGDGKAAIRNRAFLIDSVVIELWHEVTGNGDPLEGFCIAAMGGYGRRALFPYSDIDLLFLYEKEAQAEYFGKKMIAPLSQSLWDLHLRVSPTTRTLAECGKLHRGNIEFNISLLDNRYICGDQKLFEKLRKSSPAWPAHGTKNTAGPSFISSPTSRTAPVACGTIKWHAGWRR
jgi:[protein-PII] uridylyltransferase